MRPADVAWLVLVAGIVVYEALCPDEELLSRGWDRYVERFPFAARVVPFVVTAHVVNLVPARVDPVSGGFWLLRWFCRRMGR